MYLGSNNTHEINKRKAKNFGHMTDFACLDITSLMEIGKYNMMLIIMSVEITFDNA